MFVWLVWRLAQRTMSSPQQIGAEYDTIEMECHTASQINQRNKRQSQTHSLEEGREGGGRREEGLTIWVINNLNKTLPRIINIQSLIDWTLSPLYTYFLSLLLQSFIQNLGPFPLS